VTDSPCERVLVVDDSPDMLMSMRELLELEGTRVATATSCDDADAVVADGFDPNVIVVDVLLGGGDRGDEYARAFRALHPATRIVLMSGDIHALRQLETDVDATLRKPFHVEELLEILSTPRAPAARRR
jgi:CheY-like chemotaxis protein